MKTSRLLMIAAVLALTFASFSTTSVVKADQITSNKVILELTLEEAMQNPDLVMTMRQQISLEFVNNGESPILTAHIYFGNVHVSVTGPREQWILFLHSPLPHTGKALVN
jgi:hypothetical protein